MVYKYPHAEFPYARLIGDNRSRGGRGMEFELLDSGVFHENRYFDIFIEYAKAGPEDICIRIEAFNRGPDAAELHVVPHLWFRNTWAGARSAARSHGSSPSAEPGTLEPEQKRGTPGL